MSNPNSHIENFLNYYYSFGQEPGYAVLLKGKWGTGKTWFINQNLMSFEERGGKHLYVSLYGVTSFDEIEDEFFKQLHPLLSSKSMALTGKIAKGLLKATLKVDLDGDGKADGSVSAQAPNIDLPDYLTDTSGFVIVFDDLERATISLDSLLGYINHYVEHQGYKVILLANEEEIFAQQENNENLKLSYQRVKEKLIGKTFEVEPDLLGALDSFISGISDSEVKALYESQINVIAELYDSSTYQNLRHLKQALWDFERFVTFLSDEAKNKKDLLFHLLKIFLVLSFEIKSGDFLPKEISSFHDDHFSSFMDRSAERTQDSIYQKLSKKYKTSGLIDLLIEESLWVDFFDRGFCSTEAIEDSLLKSEYFKEENMPNWEKLWHFNRLSDDEFDGVLSTVEKDFYGKKFTEVGIVQHVAGTFLWLSEIKLLNKTKQEILEFSQTYIDYLKEEGLLTSEGSSLAKSISNDAWGGLGFHKKESDEFKEIIQHIDRVIKQLSIDKYPEAGNELLSLIDTDPDLFYERVTSSDDSGNAYYKIPIFEYIAPQDFVTSFISANPNTRDTVCYAFSGRYKVDNYNELLMPELKWLESVVKLLEEEIESLEGKVSSYHLRVSVKRYFRPALEKLEQYEVKKQR